MTSTEHTPDELADSAINQSATDPNQDGPIDEDLLAAAYRLLADRPALGLRQFADILNCPEERVRDALGKLVDLALPRHGGDRQFESPVAAGPLAAMHDLLAREDHLIHQSHRPLRRDPRTLAQLVARFARWTDNTGPDRIAEHLTDPQAVSRRLRELVLSVREELLAFIPDLAVSRSIRGGERLDLALLERGVRLRMMFPDSVMLDPGRLSYVQELDEAGADIRLIPELPMHLVLMDERAAIAARDPRDRRGDAVAIYQEIMIDALLALFETCWEKGTPLRHALGEADECSSAERALVRLLATGAKDDAIARQMGTSVRTIRRSVSALMSRAGVSSRFAFGAYAAAHGWI